MDEKAVLARINALLALESVSGEPALRSRSTELYQGTLTVMAAVYGERSAQVEALKDRIEGLRRAVGASWQVYPAIIDTARGALTNIKGEIEQGMLGSLVRTITGEVLSDFVQLAKASLEQDGDSAKNVAAVLAAAAFEDTIRRMGTAFTGIVTRDDLQRIITELKNRGILQGSQVGVVQAHLQFRNDALHADWGKIDRVAVSTALELVQNLLLKHFS